MDHKDVHALLPRFSSQLGHIYHYHIALEKSLTLLGWSYWAYIPKKAEMALPPNWNRCLANDILDKRKGIWQKFRFIVLNFIPFRKIFHKIGKNASSIVFIEHFELHHLASIALAILFLKTKFEFWILHRYELNNKKTKTLFHRCFIWVMKQKLGENRVKCLTDSELLAQVLSADLKCHFWTLPIPHAEQESNSNPKNRENTQFWWPGGLIRDDKGLYVIRNLLSKITKNSDIKLIIAENAKAILGPHPQIEYIPTFLPRNEYLNQMVKSGLILLPYSQRDYAFRTSGIFVEAVSSGAIPVTTRGTWMAYELGKFQLSELIFQWNEDNIIELLCQIVSNKNVKTKLEKMKTHYQNFHSYSGFANTITRF